MSLVNDVESMYKNTKAAYAAIDFLNGVSPTNKNLENLVTALDTLPIDLSDGTEWGTLYLNYQAVGHILTASDYQLLGNASSQGNIQFSFGLVSKSAITGYSFGKLCTSTSDYFMSYCYNLKTLTHTAVIETIGEYFLADTVLLESDLDLSNVIEIGNAFLYNTLSRAGLHLGNKLKSIGNNFMSKASNFNKDFTLPASVESIGLAFMANAHNFTSTITIETDVVPSDATSSAGSSLICRNVNYNAYKQGIKITGSGASTWKTALPDKADNLTNSYRKLILVE